MKRERRQPTPCEWQRITSTRSIVRRVLERRERQERENALRVYLAEGGTVDEFERSWPDMREEMRRQRVMHAEREAREGQRASRVSRI